MLKIAICYFSGTGNTEIVSKLFSKAFERKQTTVTLFKIEEFVKNKLSFCPESYDVIGIGHPVLGFGATGLVEQFANMLPPLEGKKAFVFKTASSPHYVNRGASDTIIKALTKKGYAVFHDSIFAMPCNWFLRYDDSLVKQLFETAERKVEKAADDILNGKTCLFRTNAFLKRLLRIVYFLEDKYGAKVFGKGLRASASCTMCKTCVRNCPTANISETNGSKVRFGANCIWCMRCLYSCPQKAIYATIMPSCVIPDYNGGSRIQKIVNNPDIENIFVTEKSKGYYKHFYDYIHID